MASEGISLALAKVKKKSRRRKVERNTQTSINIDRIVQHKKKSIKKPVKVCYLTTVKNKYKWKIENPVWEEWKLEEKVMA